MISDAKIRAHLLTTFHGLRENNAGWVPTSDMNLGGLEAVTLGRIRAVCEQLAEVGLIVFKPLPSDPGAGTVGMSKITGHGCDVVDGLANSRIALEFLNKTRVGPESSSTVAGLTGDGASSQRPEATRDPAPTVQSSDVRIPEHPAGTELLTLKPTIWGMSVDLKEAYRRVRGMWLRRIG